MDSAEGAQIALAGTNKGTLPEHTDEPKKPTEKSKPQEQVSEAGLKVSDLRRGIVENDRKIEFTEKEREIIVTVFQQRIDSIKDLDKNSTSLRSFDRAVSSLGQQTLERFKAGNINKEDYALAWALIHEQVIQAQFAYGVTTDIDRSFLEKIPLLRRFAREPRADIKDAVNITPPGTYPITSEQSRNTGLSEWDPKIIEPYLRSLGNIKLKLEGKLFEKGISDSLLPVVISPGLEKSGFIMRDEVIDHVRKIGEARFPGQTAEALVATDPLAYSEILIEASHNAYLELGEERLREVIASESLGIDGAILKQRAEELEAPPSKESLETLEAKVREAETRFHEAEEKLNTFNEETVLDKQIKQLEGQNLDKTTGINNLQQEINDVTAQRDLLTGVISASAGATGGSAKDFAELTKHVAQISQSVSQFQELLHTLRSKQTELRLEQAEIQRNKTAREEEKDKLSRDDARKKEKDAAEKNKSKAEREMNKAKMALEKEKKKIENQEVREDALKQAKAIRYVIRARENYETIPEQLYDKATENEFAVKHLANTNLISGGEVDGAERLRRLTFQTKDPKEYSAEIARIVLDDEAIARGIIWIYGIQEDTLGSRGIPISDALNSLGVIKGNLSQAQNALLANPDDIAIQTQVDNLKQGLKNVQRNLLIDVIPWLNNPRVQTHDLIRFLIDQASKTASLGEPHLEISKDYQTIEHRLRG